jgi:cytidylate kinase
VTTTKKSTVQLPSICIMGAPGAGKRTVARMLGELAGYVPCSSPIDDTLVGRSVAIENGHANVQALREAGFVTVYVYAPPTTRATRLQLTNEPMGDDHGPTDLADHSLANIDDLDSLRYDVAELLSGLQS